LLKVIKGTVQPFEWWFSRRITTILIEETIKLYNSRSVNSMFVTLKMLENVKTMKSLILNYA
jgi:hypothetical protein